MWDLNRFKMLGNFRIEHSKHLTWMGTFDIHQVTLRIDGKDGRPSKSIGHPTETQQMLSR